ncbi:RBBP9/YdeN family alpha/beta hydrolase [Neokomagataea anthophila]|uniref:Alpha/beta fold hydrolase n=1 Tax=Neokomagataea anthophila TaxID=2826925 RepID=A0ABS5E9M9_9PROT|nr:alpha/beta fold hydrolase [Neokomagataea anthophila]MBR0560610.1 alpha/beta fold hydrolase [Neokomagataea anthophila]
MTRIATPQNGAPPFSSVTPSLEFHGRTALQRQFSALKQRFNLLLVPGLFGSGPLHWQSEWSHAFTLDRLSQEDWNTPTPTKWDESLAHAINAPERADKPILLIGHSLGAILCARWLQRNHTRTTPPLVAGAFLVAPADTEQAQTPDSFRIHSFAPLPSGPLAVPTTIIASENDPWLSYERATDLAQHWGSDLKSAGPRGHIGSNEPLGLWEEGAQELFTFSQTRLTALALGANDSRATHS